MLYSLQYLLHKLGLYSGPGVQPGSLNEGAADDRKKGDSATRS